MTRTQANVLVKALKRKFGGKAEFEAVDKKGRYRFAITSRQFNGMAHLDRQDQVWDLIDQTLPREASLDISMILAFAPEDLAATA